MLLAGRQFWLGPARAGQLVRFWADCDLIHLFIGGTRIKTVRSHLSVNDLAKLLADRRGPGRALTAAAGRGRRRGRGGTLRQQRRRRSPSAGTDLLAAEILAGRQVGIRIEATLLLFYDLTPANCCAPEPTRSPPSRSRNCAASARPGHHPGPRPSRSECSGGPPPPA